MSIIENILLCGFWLVITLCCVILGSMLVYTPVLLYTEAECLRNGYPESRVTVGLERYCINLDGSVNVRVDKQ